MKYKDEIKEKSSRIFLKERVQLIFEESRQTYGSHRMQKMLEREELFYSRSYIAVLMREMGLKSVLKKKYVVTTDSDHSFRIAENKLDRDFKSLKLGQKWVSDITYIRVNDKWNYLTTIMDLADRKIVGWSLSEGMTTEETIMQAWHEASRNRTITWDFIFHSDRGVQYASIFMGNLFSLNRKITQSMSRKGNCWDNAAAESLFKTIKHECTNRYRFTSKEQLNVCLIEYISWYNTKRIHSALGYKTPLEMQLELENLINNAA
jgi:transposase InsO family protein